MSLVFHLVGVMIVKSESGAKMLEHLPEHIRRGLAEARRRDRQQRGRLCLHVGDAVIPLSRMWDDGFALDAAHAPGLRGLVDIFDGPRHVAQCLIVASALEGDEMIYEFKRSTHATAGPVRDYAENHAPPAALLPDAS